MALSSGPSLSALLPPVQGRVCLRKESAGAPEQVNVALGWWEHPLPSSRVERGLRLASGLLFLLFQ